MLFSNNSLGAGYPEVKELWRTTLPKAATRYYVEAVGEDNSWLLSTYAPEFCAWISSSGVLLDSFDKSPMDEIDVVSVSSTDLSYLIDGSIIQKKVNSSGDVSTLKTKLAGVGRSQFGTSTPEKRNPFLVFQGNTVICYHVGTAGASNPLTGGISNYIRIRTNPLDQYVVAGGSAELKADVANSVPVTYQWQKDGKDLAGAALTNLRLDKIAAINSGVYSLIVKSMLGNLTSAPAKLAIVVLPKITFITNRISGVSGQVVTLSPTVLSEGPTLFQWFKDSILQPGETNNSIKIYIGDKPSNYQIEARNLAGSIRSENVIISVETPKGGSQKWAFKGDGNLGSDVAIGRDGKVYFGAGSTLHAVDGISGKSLWRTILQESGYIVAAPTIGNNGLIYAGCGWTMFALNATNGTKVWEFAAGGAMNSSATIGDKPLLYFTAFGGGIVYCVDGNNGNKIWEFSTGKMLLSSPAIGADGTVYVGSDDNKVYALNGSSGIKIWEFQTGKGVYSSPAIGTDGTIYVGSDDSKIYAINGRTGAKKWEFGSLGGCGSPVIGSNGTVYVGSFDGKLCALNGATGVKKWEFTAQAPMAYAAAVGSDETVYIGSNDKKMYAIDGNTGILRWSFQTDGNWPTSPAIAVDGTIYITDDITKLYAIASQSFGLAKSSWPKFKSDNQNTGRFPLGSGPLRVSYSVRSGLTIDIPVSPNFDTILEYSTNLNQWSEQQRFGRQTNVPSIVVPLKMDQTKLMEYWRTRNQ